MISKAVFELKSNIRNWSNQVIDFCPKGFDNVHIEIHDTICDITIKGKSEVENYHYIVTIWELLRFRLLSSHARMWVVFAVAYYE